eukprot:8324800-Ditylum_brightwellii.AAC.1
MERGNIKTSPSCVMRHVMVWENVIKEKGRNFFATIMVCVTMTWTSAALCKKDIFGHAQAIIGVTEAQARAALHFHG